MKDLSPSLSTIENRWLKPSDQLLWQLSQDESRIAPGLRDAVMKDRESAKLVKELRKAKPLEPVEIDTRLQPPAWMLEQVKARHAAQQQLTAISAPARGVMIAIDELASTSGRIERDVPASLTVLLRCVDQPKAYWQAWYVAPESAYASLWDYVLQEDDGLFDPAVTGMVQVWNPLRFRLPASYRIIGRLEDRCLQAIEALASELAHEGKMGHGSVDPVARPGLVGIRETPGGYLVVTGTPLGQPQQDPRCHYQDIYRQVASLLHEEATAAPAPWWQRWLENEERFAADLNWICAPPPPVFVMGAESNASVRFERILDNRLSIQLLASDTVQELRFHQLVAGKHIIEIEADGELEWRGQLSAAHPDATWQITSSVQQRGAILVLRDEDTQTTHRLELPGQASS